MKYRYQSGSAIHEVVLERRGDGYRVTIDGQAYDAEVLNAESGALSLRLSDPAGTVRSHVVYWAAEKGVKWLSSHGCTYRLERPASHRSRSAAGSAAEDSLRAPMPAR